MYRRVFQNVPKSVAAVTRQASTTSSTTTAEEPDVGAAVNTRPRIEKSINQVTLLGRVGVTPQSRGTEEHPVTIFSMATHISYKYQTGDIQVKTEWHRVSVFRPYLRETVYKYLTKGQRVLVQGKLMYGQVTDAGGTIHTTATIVADDVIFLNKSQDHDEDVVVE